MLGNIRKPEWANGISSWKCSSSKHFNKDWVILCEHSCCVYKILIHTDALFTYITTYRMVEYIPGM